ncbi:MAG: hypothetical protein ACYDAD_14195 [Acidimicrobiales bacterium]
MTEDIRHVYAAEIVKFERNEDGDLVVFGRATGPDLDADEQICDPDWLRAAMPDWYKWGNVREMHTPIAAGTGVELTETEDGGWDLSSVVVDPGSAKKVEKGVLRGYSIGIKNPRVIKDSTAKGGRIVGGQIVEISLVDRPCNPTCSLVTTKAIDGELTKVEELVEAGDESDKTVSAEQRRQYASSGVAMPNGDFPIPDLGHLRSAIGRLANYQGDKAKARAHIRARARALGHPELIPEDWKAADADLAKDAAEPVGGDQLNLPDGPGHGQHDKFFRKAWVALATLIGQEAAEMAILGEDEIDCIQRLVDAACALRSWAIGEAREGEDVTSQIANGEQILAGGPSGTDNGPNVTYMANSEGNLRPYLSFAVATDERDPMLTKAVLTAKASELRKGGAAWDQVAGELLAVVKADRPGNAERKAAKREAKAAAIAELALLSEEDRAGVVEWATAVKAAGTGDESDDLSAIRTAVAGLTKTVETLTTQQAATEQHLADTAKERDALKGELDKVLKMAVPQGPSRIRKPSETAVASKADALRMEIAYYREAADRTAGKLADGYIELADAAESKLEKLLA